MTRRAIDPFTSGVALIMVLLVLSALAIVAGPFAVSMTLHERASHRFGGEVKARLAAEGARNHAIARLQGTLRALESDLEAVELDELRPRDPGERSSYRPAPSFRLFGLGGSRTPRRSRGGSRRSLVRRADLGERPEPRWGTRNTGRRARDARGQAVTRIDQETPNHLLVSRKGPSEKDYDAPSDLEARLPGPIILEDPQMEISFNSKELSTSATVQDEQGKINANTAPPNLIANLFGVTRLRRPLKPGEIVMSLEDSASFWTDLNKETLDGALVVAHPDNARVEAITYRIKQGNDLLGLFRGAFLSVPYDEEFPAGSLVYDLRGWKIGHHRLRAQAEGGFAPQRLAEFASVESIREIASWQIASLFLLRFRGEGLTAEFLQQNGINARKLEELGLDPELFGGDDPDRDPELKEKYNTAIRSLRKLRVPSGLVEALRKARGTRAVLTFEARINGLKRNEVGKAVAELKKALERGRRQAPRFHHKYLEAALENLAEVYQRAGIETVLPEELEVFRDSLTVCSQVPARWSEAQCIPEEMPAGSSPRESFQWARRGDLGGGALVRIRLRSDPSQVEFNRLIQFGKSAPVGGFRLAYPLLRSYPEYGAWVDALERHPVNVNTASERVLAAVFTGVCSFERPKGGEHLVSPQEARELASLIRSKVPLKGHIDFQEILIEAAQGGTIDGEDVKPLLLNAIQPNDPRLRVSTTGLCYSTGDIYTIESKGILRSDAGGLIAAKHLREVVEISSAQPLRLGLFTQADFTAEHFLRWSSDPESQINAIGSPGVRSNLVLSTPLLVRNPIPEAAVIRRTNTTDITLSKFPYPGGEVGTLRLMNAESFPIQNFAHGDLYQFRNTLQGLELGPGEPFVLDISGNLQGGGSQINQLIRSATGGSRSVALGGGQGGAGLIDMTNLPASVDFWVRFRSYPEAFSEGMAILIDAGADVDRNRISLLYDRARSEFVARIYDSSLPDPSIPDGKQFLEVRARRPLDLETWYHLRLAWDGAFAGGLQMFIDGLPVGRSTFATDLAADLPAQGAGALALKNRSVLPARGGGVTAVRVGNEIIELEGGGQIRRRQQSHYRRWLESQGGQQANQDPNARIDPTSTLPQTIPGTPGSFGPDEYLMRGPWNNRLCAAEHHPRGTPVSIHGYSLEIRRKIFNPRQIGNQPRVHQASGNEPVWSPCGLSLADDLLTWRNFPPEVIAIRHFVPEQQQGLPGQEGTPGRGGIPGQTDQQQGQGSASLGNFIAPVFELDLSKNMSGAIPGVDPQLLEQLRTSNRIGRIYSAELQWGGQIYNASDFFQREGVLMASLRRLQQNKDGSTSFPYTDVNIHYQKAPLPPDHPTATATVLQDQKGQGGPGQPGGPGGMPNLFGDILLVGQRTGLRVVRWDPLGEANFQAGPELLQNTNRGRLRPISVLASGPAANLYPPSGILEIRGSPPPWCNPRRPDLSTAPLFQQHPDDTVEWIRYAQIYNGRMFVGWASFSSSHRGYPRGEEYSNQMFHRAGQPLRLVMELADGGAGFGDYVSIVTDNPESAEPIVRRIYNVSERSDGRVFVSLVDVDQASGREIPGVVPYRHQYTRDMNPRLVKFPSGALPQVGTGRMVFFGESGTAAGGGAGFAGIPGMPGIPGMQQTSIEEEPTAGTIVDEIRRSVNWTMPVDPGRGQRIKHVLVPLENGAVRFQQTGMGQASISGVIPEGRSITPESPMEVLVVSTGRDPWPLFARGVERGLLRIGDELFFFENPQGGQEGGTRSARAGSTGSSAATRGQMVDAAWGVQGASEIKQFEENTRYTRGMRHPHARNYVWRSPPVQMGGPLEREGFIRIDDNSAELRGYYEIFYYRQFAGNHFANCLRGLFQTPLVMSQGMVDESEMQTTFQAGRVTHGITNITTRIRLMGRSLLGTEPKAHGFGDPVSLMPYLNVTEITGPMTDTGLPVKDARGFPVNGYLLLDPGFPGTYPFEIIAYKGRQQGLFQRPRDESGRGILRAAFGTMQRPIFRGMFAYGIPYRHYDRYEAGVESEDLAYLQKSFRIPGAHWRFLQWRERRPRGGKERLCDIVVLARVDGSPDWAAKPSNQEGGLYFFEEEGRGSDLTPKFPLDCWGDELEVRIYFRYKMGSFMRVNRDLYRDDWKETPVLEWLAVEYEKAGRIVRHEEPPD